MYIYFKQFHVNINNLYSKLVVERNLKEFLNLVDYSGTTLSWKWRLNSYVRKKNTKHRIRKREITDWEEMRKCKKVCHTRTND